LQGGYTWTVSFLEDFTSADEGDLPAFIFTSSLATGTLYSVTISWPGTIKTIQSITVSSTATPVTEADTFTLSYLGATTGLIPINFPTVPASSSYSCDGNTRAVQMIQTSTVDTTQTGGDNTVSPLLSFTISYGSMTTVSILAQNDPTCIAQGTAIQTALQALPTFYSVTVASAVDGLNDLGCMWTITFNTVSGNIPLLKVRTILHQTSSRSVFFSLQAFSPKLCCFTLSPLLFPFSSS
jgi:hypothetical protein